MSRFLITFLAVLSSIVIAMPPGTLSMSASTQGSWQARRDRWTRLNRDRVRQGLAPSLGELYDSRYDPITEHPYRVIEELQDMAPEEQDLVVDETVGDRVTRLPRVEELYERFMYKDGTIEQPYFDSSAPTREIKASDFNVFGDAVEQLGEDDDIGDIIQEPEVELPGETVETESIPAKDNNIAMEPVFEGVYISPMFNVQIDSRTKKLRLEWKQPELDTAVRRFLRKRCRPNIIGCFNPVTAEERNDMPRVRLTLWLDLPQFQNQDGALVLNYPMIYPQRHETRHLVTDLSGFVGGFCGAMNARIKLFVNDREVKRANFKLPFPLSCYNQ